MLTVDDYARIRRAYRDGMSICEIARRFHHSRRKVREVLRGDGEKLHRPRGRRAWRSCDCQPPAELPVGRPGARSAALSGNAGASSGGVGSFERLPRGWKLPAAFGQLRERFEGRHGSRPGVRQYIRVLQLLAEHPLEQVQQVIERLCGDEELDADWIIRRVAERVACERVSGR